MHYICSCAILGAWRRKNHLGPELDSALLAGFLRVALPRRTSVVHTVLEAALWLLLLGANLELALLLLRCVRPKGGISDQARRLALAQFGECPFCYESHPRVCTLACGGRTSTRSHGAAPAQKSRLRLKRLPPKAVPWFPPFKSSTPE